MATAEKSNCPRPTESCPLDKDHAVLAPTDLIYFLGSTRRWTEERRAKTLARKSETLRRFQRAGSDFGFFFAFIVLSKGMLYLGLERTVVTFLLWAGSRTFWTLLFNMLALLFMYFGLPRWLTFGYKMGGWLPLEVEESMSVEGKDGWPVWVRDARCYVEARWSREKGIDVDLPGGSIAALVCVIQFLVSMPAAVIVVAKGWLWLSGN
ncbi:hypothetical protein Tdes44962_MAKER09728 [Teratosphaeria destructans]|uniref:Uncharacterized protein n=1 Tax=Teratosphaeria destructans TaxID=418781 RepID=A0A9W7SRW5_9PEZI|nr:hypothetical protein Tdes44962_MAKER09728 [Teratosphaeria destructans]